MVARVFIPPGAPAMTTIAPRPPDDHDDDNSDDYPNTPTARSRSAWLTIRHNPLHLNSFA
jgi:hypothetical protein